MKTPACSAFTRIELVVALAVLAAGCGMLFTGCNEAHAQGVVAEVRRKAAMTAQLNNGRQIYLAMRIYSSDSEGTFPAFKDPDEVGAAAVDYLRVCGHLVFAYLWARMAKVALAKESSGDPFYAAKLATARFYFAKLLPETAGLIRTARAGAAPMMAMDVSMF